MGWEMPWVTITDRFDLDFGVDEWHGTNAFIRDGDRIFRTYFINGRGDEAMGSTWSYLDMTALGRQEEWEDSPEGYPQDPPYSWWSWHDVALPAGEESPGLVQLRIARVDRGVGRRHDWSRERPTRRGAPAGTDERRRCLPDPAAHDVQGAPASGPGSLPSTSERGGGTVMDGSATPAVVDRAEFQSELDELRVREKAHTREGDAIAAARRRLPMVEVDSRPRADRSRRTGHAARRVRGAPSAHRLLPSCGARDCRRPEQCEGCTWCTSQVGELSYLHSRDITFAVFCQGPYDESRRYRDFMGWDMPWYSAQSSLDAILAGKTGSMHLVCYLRDGDRVFETYWTTGRGVEAMDYSYALWDLTVFGRQEPWEDSPTGWPQSWQVDGSNTRIDGRPIAQWSRLDAGRSDDLG